MTADYFRFDNDKPDEFTLLNAVVTLLASVHS